MRPLSLAPLFLLLALAPLVTTGCSSGSSVLVSDGGDQWIRRGDHWAIRQVDSLDDSVLEVELTVERDPARGTAIYRIDRIDLFPPGDPMPRLWRLLPSDAQLRTPDDSVLEHPDAAVLAGLGKDPTIADAIDALPRCLRADSRGEALARVARGSAGPTSFDRLLEVVDAGEAGPIGALGPDGRPVGGVPHRAGAPTLEGLAHRSDLSDAQYDRLPAFVDRFPSSRLGTSYLERLVGRASVTSIADAVDRLPTTSGRAEVLTALTRDPELTSEECATIARASVRIGSASRQADLLVRLVGRAPTAEILEAVPSISSSSGRGGVLLALARMRPLPSEEAAAIARATVAVGSASAQARILTELVPSAPAAAIIEAVPGVSSSSGRGEVLLSLARHPGTGTDEAEAVARATPGIGSPSKQAAVLRELVGVAPASSILDAVPSVQSSNGRGEVLLSLARVPELSSAEAGDVAAATPAIGSSSAQSRVLLQLVGRAPVPVLLSAVPHVSSSSTRGEVLLALARSQGLSATDAGKIATASTAIGSSTSTVRVLVELVGLAPVSTVLDAVPAIGSSNGRAEVLRALARRPSLTTEEAADVARASPLLGTGSSRADLLGWLIGRAPASVLEREIRSLSSADAREELMERLERTGERRD